MSSEVKIQQARQAIATGPLSVGFYRNLKRGTTYVVTGFGVDSEELTPEVYYSDLDGNSWNRPYGLFVEKFERIESHDRD